MKTSNFQFLNPYLEEVYFVTDTDFIVENSTHEINNAYKIIVRKSDKENKAKVELLLEINMEGEHTAPFKIRMKMASDFKWGDLQEEVADSFLHSNAPALLLGYMRPLVANITGCSIYPAYNIPFINFTE